MTDPTIALTLRDILELGGVTVAATGIIVGTRYAVGAVQREGLAAIAALTVSFNAQLDSMRKALEPHADVPERLAAVEANVANAAHAAETAHKLGGIVKCWRSQEIGGRRNRKSKK